MVQLDPVLAAPASAASAARDDDASSAGDTVSPSFQDVLRGSPATGGSTESTNRHDAGAPRNSGGSAAAAGEQDRGAPSSARSNGQPGSDGKPPTSRAPVQPDSSGAVRPSAALDGTQAANTQAANTQAANTAQETGDGSPRARDQEHAGNGGYRSLRDTVERTGTASEPAVQTPAWAWSDAGIDVVI